MANARARLLMHWLPETIIDKRLLAFERPLVFARIHNQSWLWRKYKWLYKVSITFLCTANTALGWVGSFYHSKFQPFIECCFYESLVSFRYFKLFSVDRIIILEKNFVLAILPFSPDQTFASPRLKYGRADETEQCHPPAGRADWKILPLEDSLSLKSN